MESVTLLFFIILLIPGLWLVFTFRRDIKQRRWEEEEQARIEQERAIHVSAQRRFSRRPAPGDARLPVETAPPAPANNGAAPEEQAASTDWSSVRLESWQDLTSSNMGAAFEIFLHETEQLSEDIMTSQIDEAFEKFQG